MSQKVISASEKASISKALKEASSSKNKLHVIPRKGTGEWAIRRQGALRAIALVKGKNAAVIKAKKLAKSGDSVVVHKRDGTVTERIMKIIKGSPNAVKKSTGKVKSGRKKTAV